MNFLSQLHAAALSSLRSEVAELNSRLVAATRARETAETALMRAEVQAVRAEQRAEQQAVRHEERLTELHSVIAELGRQLERHRATVIAEEDESGKSPLHPASIIWRMRERILANLCNESHGNSLAGNQRISLDSDYNNSNSSLSGAHSWFLLLIPLLDTEEENNLLGTHHSITCTIAKDSRLFDK